MEPRVGRRKVAALRLRQWLATWDAFDFSDAPPRRKPNPDIYMFAMKAAELRKLCDVYKREHTASGIEGIQRYRDDTRTAQIQQYVNYGYPYGSLPERRRNSETAKLRKPGWLPTAIVVNILRSGDERRGKRLDPRHEVHVSTEQDNICHLEIPPTPAHFAESLAPFEVIDGQHRLWAFDEIEGGKSIPEDFELPVVAFHGLDVAWQAYLFWSINVSPKRINPSHAFDLYPLLRSEDWLDQVGELTVYREARAQELVSILNEFEVSSWNSRINMLGEKGHGDVSQAAWVRGLISSYFSTGRGSGRFGLFQSPLRGREEPLEWSLQQQSAFLIALWSDIESSIERSAKQHWWIRCYESNPDRAFKDKTSMLNQDMGVRAISSASNDVFFRRSLDWGLDKWDFTSSHEGEDQNVADALASLDRTPFRERIREFAAAATAFDWRSVDGPKVTSEEARSKRAYRGSGGYTALLTDLLELIAQSGGHVGQAAEVVSGEAANR